MLQRTQMLYAYVCMYVFMRNIKLNTDKSDILFSKRANKKQCMSVCVIFTLIIQNRFKSTLF